MTKVRKNDHFFGTLPWVELRKGIFFRQKNCRINWSQTWREPWMEFSHTGLNASKLIFFGTVTPAARLYFSWEKYHVLESWVGRGGLCSEFSKISTHTHTLSNICNHSFAWITQMTNKNTTMPKKYNLWHIFCLKKYSATAFPVWEPLYTWWWSQMEEGWVGLR